MALAFNQSVDTTQDCARSIFSNRDIASDSDNKESPSRAAARRIETNAALTRRGSSVDLIFEGAGTGCLAEIVVSGKRPRSITPILIGSSVESP